MKKVRNVSNRSIAIPGVGVAEAGKTISVPDDFRNSNFVAASERVESEGNGESKSQSRRKAAQKDN